MEKQNASMERHRTQAAAVTPQSPQTVGIGQALRQAFSATSDHEDWMQLLSKLERR